MDFNINFPHLHIYLPHVIKNFSIGKFSVAMYGVCIAIGVICGLLLVRRRARQTGQNPDDYIDLAILGVIFGIIGARIYYVVFAWDMYKDNLLSIFKIWEGGLAIYGGIIAAVITAVAFSRRKKIPFFKVADTACLGLITGQILGRWGNFFNREAFGGYTDGLFAMQLPVSAVRANDMTEQLLANTIMHDGVEYIQVHPTFLYESVWNLAVLILLLFLGKVIKVNGQIFWLYLIGYGTGRFFIERLRTDQLLLPGTEVPVSQLLSGVLVIFSIVMMILFQKREQQKRNER